VSKGEALLDLVDTSHLEIEMIVPSNWVDRLKPGILLTVTVVETGEKIKAKLDRNVGVVDPVSQTIRAIGRLLVKPKNVMPGMSALIRFQQKGLGNSQ
ncbi:MAG: HlyD family efflux transporter periplasmic adaptor subunit, partial [Candidatus Marinimicrobia bacterium]|nr:HlyD family efflux transporter periplasmic adaptor subunit [Candidatus Neomarinimicrobiota bacterium]